MRLVSVHRAIRREIGDREWAPLGMGFRTSTQSHFEALTVFDIESRMWWDDDKRAESSKNSTSSTDVTEAGSEYGRENLLVVRLDHDRGYSLH
jgi:hypothetical protein